ncbi:hypothetical protein F5141DRAFT_1220170 [Pisolithus sp. B1]|nr:hypothetical protein F5141DRAFT_1220170 [Pisolithus sp. B1]
MACSRCNEKGIQLFTCPCIDTIGTCELMKEEQILVATKWKGRQSGNPNMRAGLSKEIKLAIGMEVMVTFNISMDIDIANGARGEVVEIVMDPREDRYTENDLAIKLHYPPSYVLVRMKRTKA